jgi:hypothetical protein
MTDRVSLAYARLKDLGMDFWKEDELSHLEKRPFLLDMEDEEEPPEPYCSCCKINRSVRRCISSNIYLFIERVQTGLIQETPPCLNIDEELQQTTAWLKSIGVEVA